MSLQNDEVDFKDLVDHAKEVTVGGRKVKLKWPAPSVKVQMLRSAKSMGDKRKESDDSLDATGDYQRFCAQALAATVVTSQTMTEEDWLCIVMAADGSGADEDPRWHGLPELVVAAMGLCGFSSVVKRVGEAVEENGTTDQTKVIEEGIGDDPSK